ncbi:MAG: hypothetical protein ACO1QR_06555 [Chthoniobacteraceae bacterium]
MRNLLDQRRFLGNPIDADLLTMEATRHQSRCDQIARRVAARLQVSAHTAVHVRITQRFQPRVNESLLSFRQVVDCR